MPSTWWIASVLFVATAVHCGALQADNGNDLWAVLVAGSHRWIRYRHQVTDTDASRSSRCALSTITGGTSKTANIRERFANGSIQVCRHLPREQNWPCTRIDYSAFHFDYPSGNFNYTTHEGWQINGTCAKLDTGGIFNGTGQNYMCS